MRLRKFSCAAAKQEASNPKIISQHEEEEEERIRNLIKINQENTKKKNDNFFLSKYSLVAYGWLGLHFMVSIMQVKENLKWLFCLDYFFNLEEADVFQAKKKNAN